MKNFWGSPPICPNVLCRQPYAVDSVVALRAFFPQRAKYFEHFALENQGYFLIKDDSISVRSLLTSALFIAITFFFVVFVFSHFPINWISDGILEIGNIARFYGYFSTDGSEMWTSRSGWKQSSDGYFWPKG